MSFILEAVRDKPVALFAMDDTAPFQDYSGYNASGTMSAGTAGNSVALTSGTSYSSVFSSVTTAKFPSTVFKQGAEDKPFTLEAWVYLQDKGANADVRILSNVGAYDGLTINGTKVSFSTSYATTGSAKATYDIQVNRRIHVVGIHTANKNMLYVDSILVSEVEITDAQKTDTFITTDGFLYCGGSSGGDSIAVNGLAFYGNSLTGDAVVRHFTAGNKHLDKAAVPNTFGGIRIPLSQSVADVFLRQTWFTEFDWNSGYKTDVVVEDSRLKPRLSGGVSLAGTWLDVFPMSATSATSVNGVNMMWDGEGAIVEASLNGTSWETVVRGQNLALIPPGFNPTNQDLQIRVRFTGGVTDDPAYIDSLTVVGYKTGVIPSVANRTISTTGFIQNDYDPAELRDDWGVVLPNTKTLTIGADSSPDAVLPKTIEFWAKGVFTSNITGATIYTNGTTGVAVAAGEWQHRVYTLPSGFTGDLVLTSTSAQFGQVALYSVTKTAAEVKEMYDAYVGIPKALAPDASVITITEPAEAALLYDYDWSISASG